MAVHAKYIYLARRHPSLDRSGFTARWRRHGALGMSMPRWANVCRYVHCDTLEKAAPIAGISHAYDGVGMIWYRSLTARTSHADDHASQARMEADEAETFDQPVANFGVLCAEHVLRDLPPGGLKLIRFITRSKFVSLARFEAAYERHLHAVLTCADANGGVRRYVNNRSLPAEGPEGWGLDAHAVQELWFDDEAALERVHCALHAGVESDTDGRPVVQTTSVVTNEVVLYDQPLKRADS